MNARAEPTLFLATTPALRARIEAAVALLDAVEGDPDFELDPGDTPEGGDERELEEAESGFADDDGLHEHRQREAAHRFACLRGGTA